MHRTLTGLLAVSLTASSLAGSPTYPDLPAAISSFGAAVVGDHVYVYGGHSGKAHNYSTETTRGEFCRLNLKNPDKWEQLPAGPKLQGLALVAQGGKLYRIGGMQPQNSKTEKTDTKSLSTCAVYDPESRKWTDIEPLPEPRSSHDAAVAGDFLYVFGGWRLNGKDGKSEWHDHGLKLDLSKPGAKWEKIDQPFKRRALTMAALDSKVYVMGGLNDAGKTVRTVDVFDTVSGKWSDGPLIPGDDGNGFTPASTVANGHIYLAPADGKVYRLSEKADGWAEVGEFKTKRFVARMVPSAQNRVTIIGGSSPGGLLASVEAIEPKK
jgi:N-acetylneuraminic acid mutarotase